MSMPRSLAKAVDQVARQSVGKDWGLYAALLERWEEIVGREYAAVTAPVKIVFPHQPREARRSRGVLHIRLPKGLAMEFSFRAEQIRARVNAYFGFEAVGRIVLDPAQGSAPCIPVSDCKPDRAAVEAISRAALTAGGDELQQALESFGLAVLTARARKD